jgi:hypothetical protein
MIEPNDDSAGADDIFSAMNSEFPPIDDMGTDGPVFDNDAPPADDPFPSGDKPKESAPKADDSPIIEEADEFFNDEPKEKEGEFNEDSFDKQTEELAQGMDQKASDKFKQLRQELKEFKQKQKEVVVPEDVQTKLQELELRAAEAEGLRQQVEELASVSAKVKVESSKEYKEKVLNPAIEILQEADQIAESYQIDSEVIQAIIREQDKEIQAKLIQSHLSELNEVEKQDVYRMIYEYKGLGKIRQEMLDKAEEKISQIEAQQIAEQQKQVEEEKKAVQSIQANIWDKYKQVIPGFVDENGEPTEEWTKLRNRSLSIDFNKAAGKDKAYAAFAGVALPHVIKELNNAKKLLQEYSGKEANDLLRRPKLGQPSPQEVSDPDDFLTAMRKMKFK